ncbi:GNAT family N-acetyltransferase [Rhizobium sp. CNPSo 3464]|nr:MULTISPECIES: GNAT family N-acetyltransferase [Rhizobium]MDK4743620.1 GNAT family N-acetyltransferase [Rhizobium sp. CNPSo 3464]
MPLDQEFSPSIIRTATPADVDSLSTVGSAAYAAAYGCLWNSSAALANQLATFNANAFAKLLKRADTRLWVAQLDGSIVGFLTMIIGSTNPITQEASGAEISRIYLLPGAQRLGLGRQLLNSAIAEARKEKLGHMWLEAIVSVKFARSAYLKWGFSDLGIIRFNKSVCGGLLDTMIMIKYLE